MAGSSTSRLIFLTALLMPMQVAAEDGLALLERIAKGSRQLTYSGTFVYRSGGKVDISSIAHGMTDGVEVERIEALEGSPREVYRVGGQVRCFFPDEQLLIIEERSSQRKFPALLPIGLGSCRNTMPFAAAG